MELYFRTLLNYPFRLYSVSDTKEIVSLKSLHVFQEEQAMECGGYKVVIKSSVYKLGVESSGCKFVVKGSDYELAW
jgi:hypothetical protein